MKVLQEGRKQSGWAMEKICTGKGNGSGGCGAKLLVEEADIFETSSSSYDGSTDYFRTFKCPECGTETDFDTHEIPSTIWTKTRNKSKWKKSA